VTSPSVAEGVKLFNAGKYFTAHEIWESCWHKSEGIQKERLQGLIQAAVALHHFSNNNQTGADYLLEKATIRLKNGFPNGVSGDSEVFLQELRAYISEAAPTGKSRRAPSIAPSKSG